MRSSVLSCALLAVGLATAAAGDEQEPGFPRGLSRHEAEAGRLAFTLHAPEARPAKERWPLLVALHELGGSDEDLAKSLVPLSDESRYLLVCPKAGGLGFAGSDFPALEKTVAAVRDRLRAGPCHLLGTGDAGYQAVRFALARPRLFRGVVTMGTDVPGGKPERGGDSLRLLVMKGAEDRPEACREAVRGLREHLEVAELRVVAGAGRELVGAARDYVLYFLDAASGRCEAGRDRSLAWRPPARGLPERKAAKAPGLVYLFDAAPAHAKRTALMQNEVLFDHEVREAAASAVAIIAPRKDAEKVVPGARLARGPALVVLDRRGKVAGVLQRKVGAKALAALLRSQ
jgi:pimeloyl-ACP methyl ester carboxylesterase